MNRSGKRVSAEKGKPGFGPEKTSTKKPDKARVDKAEKNKQLTVDESFFFGFIRLKSEESKSRLTRNGLVIHGLPSTVDPKLVR